MNLTEYDNHIFENEVYTEQTVSGKEFQDCQFKNCDFTYKLNDFSDRSDWTDINKVNIYTLRNY